ncbi:unnamed protein product [Caenorhabditis nigoni]
MECETIFSLSLTSRNLLKLLKQSKWKPIEVAFVFDWRKFQIHFGDSTAPSELISKEFDWYEMFPYGFFCGQQVHKLETKGESREEIVMRMYKHFLELFEKCQNLRFGARVDTLDHYVPIPSLNIATFKVWTAKYLTNFMKNHLDLKLLVLEEQPTKICSIKRFGEIPGIISVRNMRVVCFEKHFLDYMRNFKGVNAYFCGPTEAYQIRNFVYGWLNGQYSENLNLIHIEQKDGELFRPDLLENYRQNQWDLNRMSLEYQLDEGDKYYTQFPGPFKMENAVYVQRESDGKILSLQSTSRVFIGCVWNHEDVFRE